MNHYVFRAFDRPGAAEIRARVREAHRAYIRVPAPDCRVVAGGPLTDDKGGTMIGTLLILEAPDRAAAERFLAGDPYAAEPLFERTELTRWTWGLGQPVSSVRP